MENDIGFSDLSFLPPSNQPVVLSGTYLLCTCVTILFVVTIMNICGLLQHARAYTGSVMQVQMPLLLHQLFDIGCCILIVVYIVCEHCSIHFGCTN